jgi:hypothetical protein
LKGIIENSGLTSIKPTAQFFQVFGGINAMQNEHNCTIVSVDQFKAMPKSLSQLILQSRIQNLKGGKIKGTRMDPVKDVVVDSDMLTDSCATKPHSYEAVNLHIDNAMECLKELQAAFGELEGRHKEECRQHSVTKTAAHALCEQLQQLQGNANTNPVQYVSPPLRMQQTFSSDPFQSQPSEQSGSFLDSGNLTLERSRHHYPFPDKSINLQPFNHTNNSNLQAFNPDVYSLQHQSFPPSHPDNIYPPHQTPPLAFVKVRSTRRATEINDILIPERVDTATKEGKEWETEAAREVLRQKECTEAEAAMERERTDAEAARERERADAEAAKEAEAAREGEQAGAAESGPVPAWKRGLAKALEAKKEKKLAKGVKVAKLQKRSDTAAKVHSTYHFVTATLLPNHFRKPVVTILGTIGFLHSNPQRHLIFDCWRWYLIARDGLRGRTTRERSVSRSGFRVIGPISCKKYLNPTGIGLIPSENSPTPGREREGGSNRPSGSG